MTFELYGTTAAASRRTRTTLDELAAAGWQQIAPDRWKMMWPDRTPDYGYGEDGEGQDFTCELYRDGDAGWAYDHWHSQRGGEQLGNGLVWGEEWSVEKVHAETRKRMEDWIERWTDDAAAEAANREDEDE